MHAPQKVETNTTELSGTSTARAIINSRASSKIDTPLQTRDFLLGVIHIHISAHDIFSRWHRFGDLDFLRDVQDTLLERTSEVDFLDRFTEIQVLVVEGDISIPYDLHMKFGARVDLSGHGTAGVDCKIHASSTCISLATAFELERS